MTSSLRKTGFVHAMFWLCIILSAVIFIGGCTQSAQQKVVPPTQQVENMTNPASSACVAAGGSVQILKNADGSEYGMCSFANGTSCEEWALFRGEGCKPGISTTPTAQATQATTSAGEKKMVTFTEADNGTTQTVTQGTRFAVQLAENPTTGFQWNATVTPGLTIQSSDYAQDPKYKGLAGAGGFRTWVITANNAGPQKFSATYMRSWEPVTGNETAYFVNIQVAKP